MPGSSHPETYGLTETETRLFLLTAVFLDEGGNIDWERIAKKTNVSVASAKTVFRKAKKKLLKNLGEKGDAEPKVEALVPADDSQ
ncbi:hypothetical protein N7486_008752 [Penicillium sp. IBT 16267x]|nr:hypothetical protein N7486_008752 [Penicillium sp. IBT 16267x]